MVFHHQQRGMHKPHLEHMLTKQSKNLYDGYCSVLFWFYISCPFGSTESLPEKELQCSALDDSLREMTLLKERNKLMEGELKEMQERYSEISLKFAEVEGERQQLVMRVRNLKNARKNPWTGELKKNWEMGCCLFGDLQGRISGSRVFIFKKITMKNKNWKESNL